jgi:hypothetical protein
MTTTDTPTSIEVIPPPKQLVDEGRSLMVEALQAAYKVERVRRHPTARGGDGAAQPGR